MGGMVRVWEAGAYRPALADVAQAGLTWHLVIFGSRSPELSAQLLDLLPQPLSLSRGLHAIAAT